MTTATPSSPARRPIDVLHSFYETEQRYVAAGGAPAGADFTELGSHLHPDIVARQGPTVPWPGEWHGAAGMERLFAEFTETWSSLQLTDIKHFEGEDGVAIYMRMRATARSTGKLLDTRVGHFMMFRDGLISEINVFYLDPVEVMRVTMQDA